MDFELRIRPRISETDMFGHINNVAVIAWLEEGRSYLVREILPDREQLPPFILARIEIDYRAQLYFGHEVTISTHVERLGTSSVVMAQRILQQDRNCAAARSVLVHFDRATQRSAPLAQGWREGFGLYLRPVA